MARPQRFSPASTLRTSSRVAKRVRLAVRRHVPLRLHGEIEAAEALPEQCPYRLADLVDHDWYPASRHGLEL